MSPLIEGVLHKETRCFIDNYNIYLSVSFYLCLFLSLFLFLSISVSLSLPLSFFLFLFLCLERGVRTSSYFCTLSNTNWSLLIIVCFCHGGEYTSHFAFHDSRHYYYYWLDYRDYSMISHVASPLNKNSLIVITLLS